MRKTGIWILASILVLTFNVAYAQYDTLYIKEISRKKAVQFHLTAKDFSFKVSSRDGENLLFQNSNLGLGVYLKKNIYEIFLTLPLTAFNNQATEHNRVFGTGFGLNFYPKKFHFNYNFKYVQGYENLNQVRQEKLKLLTTSDFLIFNKLNAHYVVNGEQFSMMSALRFNNRQIKSAGSLILYTPISYHIASLNELVLGSRNYSDVRYERIMIGCGAGYGYSHVLKDFTLSMIGKVGLDFRYATWNTEEIDNSTQLFPSFNLITSAVYDFNNFFAGVNMNWYPEYEANNMVNVEIQNWKVRLYVGRRFY